MANTDLHMHSAYSLDGEHSIAGLIDIAHKQNVTTIAIADHNTVEGAIEAQNTEHPGLRIIPAIEIDAQYKGRTYHILGYNIDLHDPRYQQLHETVEKQDYHVGEAIMDKVEKLGIIVDKDAVRKLVNGMPIAAESIAEIILAAPRNDNHPLLADFRPNGKRSDNPYVNFYWDVCAQDKPAYVPVTYMSVQEAIELIHSTGGKAVFAQPGNNLKSDYDLCREILDLGLDGIEACASYHTPEQNTEFVKIAKEKNLFYTTGSDFHGKTKPAIQMGSVNPMEDPEDFQKQLPL